MNLNKVCMGLIVLLAFFGIACGNISNNEVYGAETWIKANETHVGMSGLTATIHVTIKNNKDHVQYFKISHIYKGSLVGNDTIKWVIDWTNPKALKMVDAVSPELGGDYGWKIQPGETKEVCFKVNAIGPMGEFPSYIYNAGAQENTYWPLIPDPGIYASWFQPNEIEMLNPDLDLKCWKGTFTFLLTNHDSNTVSGIIRAPVVPTDSKLTYSNPKATFTDKDLVMNGKIAAWDVTIGADSGEWFTYTYEWPLGSSSSSSGKGTYSSSIPKSNATGPSSLPTRETGLPYGLFVIGGILAAGGVVYSKFMR
ncbi:hypothetical protein [Methanobacterium sp. ACI-7]|uniref:hypothetical protein n=1 Tax=unclassified Methanobacterium TaxID=2627676 RepID=UPI0039C25300